MPNNIEDAMQHLLRLRKTTKVITCDSYEVDGKRYSADEYIRLANSTEPATWFRSL